MSYRAEQVIPSNKTIIAPVSYPSGYDAVQAMSDLNLTKRQFLDARNRARIAQEAYNHSPAYQEQRISDLEAELAQAKMPEVVATVTRLNQTVEQHGSWLESIRSFINQTFGVSLW